MAKDDKKGMSLKERLAAKKNGGKVDDKKAEAKEEKKAPVTIEVELLKISGEKPQGAKESKEEYLVRLATALSGLPDDDYAKLSAQSQKWFGEATPFINDAIDDKGTIVKPEMLKKVPEFPEVEAEKDEKADDKASDKKDEKKDKDDKKAKDKDEKPADKDKKDDKKEKKGRATEDADEHVPSKSPSSIARIIVCEKLGEISLEDLKKEVKSRGAKISDSQAHAVHNITKRVIKTLRALKLIREPKA